MNEFNDCMDSSKYAKRVKANYDESQRFGAEATPTFLIISPDGNIKSGSTKINSDSINSGISITKKITPARIVYAILENTSLIFFNLEHWLYYL